MIRSVEDIEELPNSGADMTLDSTDRAILQALLEDSRASQRELSRIVGVAQGTITNRLKKLESQNIIQGYSVVLDPESVGWSMTIMAGLRIAKGKMINVQQKIAADPRVFSVYDVTGDWDSMVLARVRDRADLDDLTKTVFTLEGVTRSFTHVVLNTVKEDGFAKPAPDKNNEE
ncbi:MAG: AsnC family transcriptional regulator [Euryarchaeota archaeon]|nr:AsnC family transcriptional regulator [Euryarchaeota archaeon]